MKKLFFLVLLLTTPFIYAQNNYLELFQKAGKFYENGQFNEAIKIYESLCEQGQANAHLYYNLGNAYYKTQALGMAILNYEKAIRLAPHDKDILFNINFLRQQVKEPQLSFIESVSNYINNLLTLNNLTILCSIIYLVLIACIFIYLFNKRQVFLLFIICFFIMTLGFSSWLYLKIKYEVYSIHAITITGPADVRNGPGAENSIGFTLPEGRKVVVLGEKDDWAAIGLHVEGLKGWIEKKYIKPI